MPAFASFASVITQLKLGSSLLATRPPESCRPRGTSCPFELDRIVLVDDRGLHPVEPVVGVPTGPQEATGHDQRHQDQTQHRPQTRPAGGGRSFQRKHDQFPCFGSFEGSGDSVGRCADEVVARPRRDAGEGSGTRSAIEPTGAERQAPRPDRGAATKIVEQAGQRGPIVDAGGEQVGVIDEDDLGSGLGEGTQLAAQVGAGRAVRDSRSGARTSPACSGSTSPAILGRPPVISSGRPASAAARSGRTPGAHRRRTSRAAAGRLTHHRSRPPKSRSSP